MLRLLIYQNVVLPLHVVLPLNTLFLRQGQIDAFSEIVVVQQQLLLRTAQLPAGTPSVFP